MQEHAPVPDMMTRSLPQLHVALSNACVALHWRRKAGHQKSG
jgi:hypothetical protein